MTCLHLLSKSPQTGLLDETLKALAPGDGLLLLEDGVYCLRRASALASLKRLPRGVSVYCLIADLRARGIAGELPGNAQPVDYDGFVALCANHDKTASWF